MAMDGIRNSCACSLDTVCLSRACGFRCQSTQPVEKFGENIAVTETRVNDTARAEKLRQLGVQISPLPRPPQKERLPLPRGSTKLITGFQQKRS